MYQKINCTRQNKKLIICCPLGGFFSKSTPSGRNTLVTQQKISEKYLRFVHDFFQMKSSNQQKIPKMNISIPNRFLRIISVLEF